VSPVNGEPEKDDRLDSWKEIANFLKRGVRTVQRWEKEEGFPIHRHQHAKLGSIYALRSEVNAWQNGRDQNVGNRENESTVLPEDVSSSPTKLLVLPFENLSRDPDQDYFSDGLTEEMIAQLGRFRPAGLGVIARTTAMHYKLHPKPIDQIGRDLKVSYVLEGSVRRDAGRVRITTSLVRISDQTPIWSGSYDRDLRDVLSLQSEVATAIAGEIHMAFPSGIRRLKATSVDPIAYENYLKGRALLNALTGDSVQRSIGFFQSAIRRQPKYALAFAGMADAYGLLSTIPFDAIAPRKSMPKAEAAARKALVLDSSLAEAHSAIGLVRHHYHWDWRGAEVAYRKALELNPQYSPARLRYVWLLLALGRIEEAMLELKKAQAVALEFDPHFLGMVQATLAVAFYFSRQYDRSIAEAMKAVAMDPGSALPKYVLVRAFARKGEIPKIAEALARAKQTESSSLLSTIALAHADAVAGRKADAQKTLQQLKTMARRRYVPATYFGILYAALGDTNQSFRYLEKAYKERADGLTFLNVEPLVDELRGDVRFQKLVKKIGLTS
jgi:TolB-like protein/tetratricopeptide (TPR) repeat protein